MPELDDRLAPLYRDPPEEFVRNRDALAKQLREEGDRDAAARVKKLRRPSQAAWLINRVSADEPERARGLVEAADNLVAAQQRMLDEGGDARELRTAAADERDRIEEMVAAARRVANDHPRPVSASVIDKVAQTLQAVGSHPELRDQLLRGRVEVDHRAATMGLPSTAALQPTKPRARTESRAAKRAREELARLRESLGETESRIDSRRRALEEAEADVRRLKLELGESEAEVRDLRRRIADAERVVD
jgi:chromosome segregation ATPase